MQSAALVVREVVTFVVRDQVNNRSFRQACRLTETERRGFSVRAFTVPTPLIPRPKVARSSRRFRGIREVYCRGGLGVRLVEPLAASSARFFFNSSSLSRRLLSVAFASFNWGENSKPPAEMSSMRSCIWSI